MRLADFDFYRDFLIEKSGIALTQEEAYLLDSRLTPIARQWGYPSLANMTMAMRGVPSAELSQAIIEAMTMQDTSFFCDMDFFNDCRESLLPSLMQARKKKRLRVWFAGCARGQEPYSFAMMLKENPAKFSGWAIDIMASDISSVAIEAASKASYAQLDVQRGLPIRYLMKYFTKKDDLWHLRPEIRNMVKFGEFNLLESMNSLGTFDAVFCRNVLTRFDPAARAHVLQNIATVLADDGYLVLGSEEKTDGTGAPFRPAPDMPGLFIRKK